MKIIPQTVFLTLMLLGLGTTMAMHGRPKTGNHSVWITLVSDAVVIVLLWWGGFFDAVLKALAG